MPDRELTLAMIEVVKARMQEHGLSGRTLAVRLSMDPTTLSAHLRGEGRVELEEWEALALALGSNRLEELLDEARRRL